MISTTRPTKRVMITVLALAAAATVAAGRSDENDQVELTAVFSDASPLYEGNSVKASGVTVGKIESITLVDGAARVRMRVERSILPLHTDAKAVITEQDLLGERYIALDRGSADAPILDEDRAVIEKANTSRTVDLQSVLDNVDNPTGTALAALFTTLGEGSASRGRDISDAMKALTPAMRQSGQLASVLSSQNDLLAHLVDTVEPVLSAVAVDNGKKLDGLVDSADRTLGQIAADRDAVRKALTRLPSTLAAAQQTLARVARVADNATPTLAAMRPVTTDLSDISVELRRFASAADPALASLRPVLAHAQELIDRAAPVAVALRDAGPDVRKTASGGRRLVDTALSGAALGDLLEFVKNWALITSGYDGLSNYFRVEALVTPKALITTAAGAVPGLGNGSASGPAPGGATPKAKTPLIPKLPDLSNLTGLLGLDGATGLSQNQESNLLSQLLGGL
ncbi:MlaD family protein [Nocardioides sp. GCM10030258]|uniref:MlaD family protein n=1 Tax=unclassified Nocardioides TaxID=2615069 RepID=UPI00361EC8EA